MSKKSKAVHALVCRSPAWAVLRKKGNVLLEERPDDDFMKRVLEGALQVGNSKIPIRGNLCAAAIRELAGHVLHALAPDGRVSKCCWYEKEPNTSGPTRQQRATYIVQGGLPIDFVTEILHLDHKAVCRPLIKAMDRLNRATHVREETILEDDKEIRSLVDGALDGLLDLFKAARKCQGEVRRKLESEIDDAVFEAFLSEMLQELDELSTHTMIEEHALDHVEVVSIDDEFIAFAVSGTVYVELQYGSNSDLRNDIGAVMSDSYPYDARMKAKAQKPKEILKHSLEISVDNRSFYE